MKKYSLLKIFVFLLILFLIKANVLVNAQTQYDTYSGFAVPTTPTLPAQEIHPSLWFTADQVTAVKNKRTADSYATALWNDIMSDVNSFITKTPSSQSVNNRPIMAKLMAFHWIMNGDTTARRKAIECLMIAFDNVPRTATSANFSGDYDEIYRATWIQNYCEAYDWVKPQLTAAQNDTIRKKIAAEAVLLRDNMVTNVRYAPRPHNHRSKPAWGLVTTALTLSSDTRAADWLQFGLEQANTVTRYMYSSDGMYREGSHYNLYGLVNGIPALWHYKNVSSVNHFPYYQAVFEAPVRIRDGRGWLPDIEDSYVKPMPTHLVAAAYKTASTTLHPTEKLASILQWHWFNTNFFSADYTGATNDVVWNVDEFITYDPTIAKVAPQINPTQRLQSGVVVFRDNANYSSAPSRYLLFHGIAECDNHQHMDMLSYILESNNTILACDPGYGKNGYDDTNRVWYTAPKAHNIVTVDSMAPVDLDINIPPRDLHFVTSSFYDFAEKQARTAAANGWIRRGIAFPNKSFWVVYDIGTANVASVYRLNIHSRGTLTRNGNQMSWLTGSDNYGTPQKLHSYALTSGANTITTNTGLTSLYKDEITQSWVQVQTISANALFLHLLYPDNSSSSFPNVTNLSGTDFLSFKLNQPSGEHYFAVQQTSAQRTFSNYATDALYSWVQTASSQIKCFAMNAGKNFSYLGNTILTADYPVSAAMQFNLQSATLVIDTLAQATTFRYHPSIPSDSIRAVLYNGVSIPFGIEGGNIVITVSGFGKIDYLSGVTDTFDEGSSQMPKHFAIEGNYPNPFNPSTLIRLRVNTHQPVKLTIYNVLGKPVRELLKDRVFYGALDVKWDGKDDLGNDVGSGVYIFELSNGLIVSRAKGILIK